MKQLIDKSAVVAEIERIKKKECPTDTYEGRCKLFWFEQFLSFLNTLEIKEVDLEKDVNEIIKTAEDHAYFAGSENTRKNLWHLANGDDLPEIDREVVVLYQHYPLDVNEYSVGFAHRPPEYWDGKNIITNEVTRYEPKRYDKGGWNQPNVKWWLDLDLPKTEE